MTRQQGHQEYAEVLLAIWLVGLNNVSIDLIAVGMISSLLNWVFHASSFFLLLQHKQDTGLAQGTHSSYLQNGCYEEMDFSPFYWDLCISVCVCVF